MIATGLLIDHEVVLSALAPMMEAQWPDWYNPRGGSARADLVERLERNRLPLGIVAFLDDALAGTCTLTVSSGGLVTERSPWLGGLLVHPDLRRQGVGLAMLERACAETRRLGYSRLHALTNDAHDLFLAAGWRMVEQARLQGEPHAIYITAV